VIARLAPVPVPPKSVSAIFLDDLHGGSMARHKSCSALLYVEAARRAHAAGADEALLGDGEGGIAEASAHNLFAVIDGTLITPPARLPLLPGVTRAWAIKLGKAVQRPITQKDLARASEAFLTNSIRGVVPLIVVDGTKIKTGPLTRRLVAAFEQAATRSARA